VAERWFFALWPRPATAQTLAAQARPLIPHGARAAHPLDLHLTLVFLGVLTPQQLQLAVQAADTVRGARFSLDIDQVGSFAQARVLWCAPSRPPAGLADLVQGLGQGLAERGFAPENRPFRPHISLARRFQGAAADGWGRAVEWEARDFCLAHGRVGQVPRYAVVRRWPLGPSG
jgi:2'-5' RNA ligase